YSLPLPNDWLATLHTDLHWQSESWWRVFQDHEFAKLDEYFTMNLAAIFVNEERGWNIMAYIKNVTDETAITGAFLNSDDTGLTTNVFLTEPRLYGLRVTKAWNNTPWFDDFAARRQGPFPLTVELGGQVQRHDAPAEVLRPGFDEEFPDTLATFDDAQEDDLDWGDGREVKLTYRPGSGPWSVSAGLRYGKTNGQAGDARREPTDPICVFAGPAEFLCEKYEDTANFGPLTRFTVDNWSEPSVYDREEHQIVDLSVGRDIGIGGLSRSTFTAGLRHVRLQSQTDATFRGLPDWDLGIITFPPANSTHTKYFASLTADREFEGVGPMVGWDGSVSVLGNQDTGTFDLDVSLGGGVMFGDRETTVEAAQTAEFFEMNTFVVTGLGSAGTLEGIPLPVDPPISTRRSQSATAPVFSGSLGLSYKVDRFSIGAGYRWERYFEALDAGLAEEKAYDRTIDGPYLKLSVGFGG
ncbi:MAG TPA: Lpg1974 family pore-forming outer membrane protein, partial [Caulobacteraceae bacterium]